jgi:hypothetical protein
MVVVCTVELSRVERDRLPNVRACGHKSKSTPIHFLYIGFERKCPFPWVKPLPCRYQTSRIMGNRRIWPAESPVPTLDSTRFVNKQPLPCITMQMSEMSVLSFSSPGHLPACNYDGSLISPNLLSLHTTPGWSGACIYDGKEIGPDFSEPTLLPTHHSGVSRWKPLSHAGLPSRLQP